MTDTATTSYPELSLCLTAKPSNTKMGNKSKQSRATDGFTAALCMQEGRMSRGAAQFQSLLKIPRHQMETQFHCVKCNRGFHTITTEIFIIIAKKKILKNVFL